MAKASPASIKSSIYSGLSAAELFATLEQKDPVLLQKDARIDLLEEYISLSKAQRFAASSEKTAFQIHLFVEAEMETAIDDIIDEIDDESLLEEAVARNKNKTRNRCFSPSLERVYRELLLQDEEKLELRKLLYQGQRRAGIHSCKTHRHRYLARESSL